MDHYTFQITRKVNVMSMGKNAGKYSKKRLNCLTPVSWTDTNDKESQVCKKSCNVG